MKITSYRSVAFQPSSISLLLASKPCSLPSKSTQDASAEATIKRGCLLAVYRSLVERLDIYHPVTSTNYPCSSFYPTTNEAEAFEDLCWVTHAPPTVPDQDSVLTVEQQPRLFSCSQDGVIREWDWARGSVLRKSEIVTSPVWTIKASHDGLYLAAGHEDGRVSIYSLLAQDEMTEEMGHVLAYKRTIVAMPSRDFGSSESSQEGEGRITSLAWSHSKHALAIGYINSPCIKWVDAITGESLGDLDVDAPITCMQTYAHPTASPRGSTVDAGLKLSARELLLTGDTSGHFTVIDMTTLTVVQRIKVLSADVLTLTTCPSYKKGDVEQDGLCFLSGIDNKSVRLSFSPIQIAPGLFDHRWSMVTGTRFHTRDVLGMTCGVVDANLGAREWTLFSGGLDTNLLYAKAEVAVLDEKASMMMNDWPKGVLPSPIVQAVKGASGYLVACTAQQRCFEVYTGTELLFQINAPSVTQSWACTLKPDTPHQGASILIAAASSGGSRCKVYECSLGDKKVTADLLPLDPAIEAILCLKYSTDATNSDLYMLVRASYELNTVCSHSGYYIAKNGRVIFEVPPASSILVSKHLIVVMTLDGVVKRFAKDRVLPDAVFTGGLTGWTVETATHPRTQTRQARPCGLLPKTITFTRLDGATLNARNYPCPLHGTSAGRRSSNSMPQDRTIW